MTADWEGTAATAGSQTESMSIFLFQIEDNSCSQTSHE